MSNNRLKVQQDWLEEIYPRANSIVLGHGLYGFFDVIRHKPALENITWVPVLEALSDHVIPCEGLAVLSALDDANGNRVLCGECAACGSDGFIALTSKGSGDLRWLVVLSETNPFEHIELHGDLIRVVSTSGITVEVPIQRPEALSIHWTGENTLNSQAIARLGGTVVLDDLSHLNQRVEVLQALDDLKEDLLQVTFAHDQVLDIGWYPEFSAAGAFRVLVVAQGHWDRPVYSETARSWATLQSAITHALAKVQP